MASPFASLVSSQNLEEKPLEVLGGEMRNVMGKAQGDEGRRGREEVGTRREEEGGEAERRG